MNAREMHYDFKQKLNKIDSQKYRDLIVPEIDWKLNEAQEVFVKVIEEMNRQKTELNKIYHPEINDLITSASYLKLQEAVGLDIKQDKKISNRKI